MAGFQGADVDGLDQTAQKMMQAAEACTAIAAALTALSAALKAMSWTGFAAAMAAYLDGVVIPWVKAVAAALQAFAKVLQLTSSTQKETSAGPVVVSTGNGNYQTPKLPTVSAANGPQVVTVQVTITNGQTGQSSGVTVTTPQLPGQVTPTPITSGGTGTQVGTGGNNLPNVVPTGGGLNTGVTGGSAGGAAVPTPIGTGSSVGSTSGGSGGSAGGSGGATGGMIPSGGGSGSSGGVGSGGSGSGWTGGLGISRRADGGIDVTGSFKGSFGGDSGGSATPTTPVQGHSSVDGNTVRGQIVDNGSGGPNTALLAAPLGLAGLGAAALGAKGAGSGSGSDSGSASQTGGAAGPGGSGGPASTTPGSNAGTASADDAGWRLVATSDAAGQVGMSIVRDTDAMPTPLDLGSTAGTAPRIIGWLDGDGDYGFVGDDLTFTTAYGEVKIDRLTVQGNVAQDPAASAAIHSWWQQALSERAAQATPATTGTPNPIPVAAATR